MKGHKMFHHTLSTFVAIIYNQVNIYNSFEYTVVYVRYQLIGIHFTMANTSSSGVDINVLSGLPYGGQPSISLLLHN